MLSVMALLWRLVTGGGVDFELNGEVNMTEPGELRPPAGLRTSRRHTAEGVVGDRLTIRRLQRRAWKRRSGDAGYPFGHRKHNKEVRSDRWERWRWELNVGGRGSWVPGLMVWWRASEYAGRAQRFSTES